jgi:hypothetical protein
MRTNIVINEDLLREARVFSSHQTKRAIIEEALVVYISVKEREQRMQTYSERLASIQNRTDHLVLRERPSHLLRETRESR